MILNTKRLFTQLLSTLQTNVICDIGSMDGTDALAFQRASRTASIYAFEPNPENFAAMQADPQLQASGIEIVPWAVGNQDGAASFYLVRADYSHVNAERGMSSLYERSGDYAPHQVIKTRITRLDSFLNAPKPGFPTRIALWVDTEGMAFEVVEGCAGIAAQVQLLHLEVETGRCINPRQKTYGDVRKLLRKLGFAQVGTDQPSNRIQFNALFIRRDLPARFQLHVYTQIVHAHCRYLLVRALSSFCPECLRRLRRALKCQAIR